MENNEETLPSDLEEAIEILKTFYNKSIDSVKSMDENQFTAMCHHSAGRFIRNSWFLWWYPGHTYDVWPKDEPKLNAWFRELGITHADDMSGIIFTCLYRNINGIEYDLPSQVEHYKNHWKAHGFGDGIYKNEN